MTSSLYYKNNGFFFERVSTGSVSFETWKNPLEIELEEALEENNKKDKEINLLRKMLFGQV